MSENVSVPSLSASKNTDANRDGTLTRFVQPVIDHDHYKQNESGMKIATFLEGHPAVG